MRFDRHTVVLLVRPPGAPELSEEEANALQDAHLGNQARLQEAGQVIAAGPLVDQDDERLRGIAVLSVGTETARRLYSADPAVQAGRLAIEIMTWMVPSGNVHFEEVSLPHSIADAGEG